MTKTMTQIASPKPKLNSDYNSYISSAERKGYHYSNPDSDGALLCETTDFPSEYDSSVDAFAYMYSDRIREQNPDRFRKACEVSGTKGEEDWISRLPILMPAKLKEFAKVALGLPSLPKHVRVIYYFNLFSGYSTPAVQAIFKKD